MIFQEMRKMIFQFSKKTIKSFFLYHGIPLLLITKKFLFSIFWRWKVRPFLSQKVDGNMIVTNCWQFLAFNFSEMGKPVFWAKTFMGRWYLLITEKVLFWNFGRWKISSFFLQKKQIFTWFFSAFHDIPGLEKYGFFRDILKSAWLGLIFLCRKYCKNFHMWAWYLCLVEDFHDASIMCVTSSGKLQFSVKNLLSDRRGNLPPYWVQCLLMLE